MTLKKTFVAAAAIALAPLAASSSTLSSLTVGTYAAGDYNLNSNPLGEPVERSIWTPGGGGNLVTGPSISKFWSFVSGSFDVTTDGTDYFAKLTASVVNATNALATFDVTLDFMLNDEAGPGYCQFGGSKTACSDPTQLPGGEDADWDYFTFTGGIFDGTGELEGVEWEITDNANHKAQAGISANALEYGDNGFSMWFYHEARFDDGYVNTSDFSFNTGKQRGDFNIDLASVPGGPLPGVPLPAGAWLLIGGLGALGAAKRRKKAA